MHPFDHSGAGRAERHTDRAAGECLGARRTPHDRRRIPHGSRKWPNRDGDLVRSQPDRGGEREGVPGRPFADPHLVVPEPIGMPRHAHTTNGTMPAMATAFSAEVPGSTVSASTEAAPASRGTNHRRASRPPGTAPSSANPSGSRQCCSRYFGDTRCASGPAAAARNAWLAGAPSDPFRDPSITGAHAWFTVLAWVASCPGGAARSLAGRPSGRVPAASGNRPRHPYGSHAG